MFGPVDEGHPRNVTLFERRRYPRTGANIFTVFRRLSKMKEPPTPQIGYTHDFSAGGAYFYTRGELEEGDEVSLTIHLTVDCAEGADPLTLEADGKVLRVEQARRILPLGDFSGVAVQFFRELAVSF